MKLYKTQAGILIERENRFYRFPDESWDSFVNDDRLHAKVADRTRSVRPISDWRSILDTALEPPIHSQELWAAGVTYIRSKVGRQEEAESAGGSDFYARVYEAERPELFFKAHGHRVVGHGKEVRIRKDSHWNVPEPELTLLITSRGSIVGYTIGNDMSSRSIEGENPLYLPQAKTYDGCAALGPCVYLADDPIARETVITLHITRNGTTVFEGSVEIGKIRRSFEDLVSYLYRECSFPFGSMLMTGTGIVPPRDFTLRTGDTVAITIEPIGTLTNTVA
jgi:2-dehydro-3-deoxy-D-arabinonate dehydratase